MNSVPGNLLLDVKSLEPVFGKLLVRVLVHLPRHAGKDGAEVRAPKRAHLQDLLRRQVRPEMTRAWPGHLKYAEHSFHPQTTPEFLLVVKDELSVRVPLGGRKTRFGDLPVGRGRLRGGHVVVRSLVVPLRVGEAIRHEPLRSTGSRCAARFLALLSLGALFILQIGTLKKGCKKALTV